LVLAFDAGVAALLFIGFVGAFALVALPVVGSLAALVVLSVDFASSVGRLRVVVVATLTSSFGQP
jgi:hypothetical protein